MVAMDARDKTATKKKEKIERPSDRAVLSSVRLLRVLYRRGNLYRSNRSYLPGRHLRDDAPDAPWPYEICDNASNTNCSGDLCVIRPRDQSQASRCGAFLVAFCRICRISRRVVCGNMTFRQAIPGRIREVCTTRACTRSSSRPEARDARSLFCFGFVSRGMSTLPIVPLRADIFRSNRITATRVAY